MCLFIKENIKVQRHWPLWGESPHKGPVTRKIFPFDDVIINFPKLCQMEMEGRVWLECRPRHSLFSQYRNEPELHARKIWFRSLLWLTLRDVIQSFILNDMDITLPLGDLNRRINWYNAMAYNSATLCKCYGENAFSTGVASSSQNVSPHMPLLLSTSIWGHSQLNLWNRNWNSWHKACPYKYTWHNHCWLTCLLVVVT